MYPGAIFGCANKKDWDCLIMLSLWIYENNATQFRFCLLLLLLLLFLILFTYKEPTRNWLDTFVFGVWRAVSQQQLMHQTTIIRKSTFWFGFFCVIHNIKPNIIFVVGCIRTDWRCEKKNKQRLTTLDCTKHIYYCKVWLYVGCFFFFCVCR